MYQARLQRNLGVYQDGQIGRGTLTALFRKCGAKGSRAGELALAGNVLLHDYEVLDNGLRLSHFMAQVMHESDGFRHMEEIASGKAYEGRQDLGNTQPGDGRKYKGRGPIQITGRANYRRFGRKIGIALERHPELAAVPSIGLHIALEFWKHRTLNKYADRDDIMTVTRRINGGFNGLKSRKKNLLLLKSWMV